MVLNIFYKHSRIKQYLKEGRAMRIETVVNAPRDLGCNARLPNLADLQDKARAINRRILKPNVPARTPSLRVQPSSGSRTRPSARTGGGPRLCGSAILGSGPGRHPRLHPARGHRHHQQEPARLDDRTARTPYTPGQMTYDLRRLRLATHPPHRAHQPVRPDPRRLRFAVFYTKVHNRLLRPLMAATSPRHHPNSGKHCAPSTGTSATTSTAPASAKPRQNLTQTFRS